MEVEGQRMTTPGSSAGRRGLWPFRVASAVYALWVLGLAALAVVHRFLS